MKLLHSPFFLFFPAFPPHFLFLVCKLKYCKLFLPKIVKVRVVMARCIPEKQRHSLLAGHRWEERGFCMLLPLPACAEMAAAWCFELCS